MTSFKREVIKGAFLIGCFAAPFVATGLMKAVDKITDIQDRHASEKFAVYQGETIVFDEEFKRIVRQEGL